MHRRTIRAHFRLVVGLLATLCSLGGTSAAHAAVFTQVAPGLDHTCGLRADGTVWCWGNGRAGQLGVIDEMHVKVPIKVIGSYQTTQLTSGSSYWCERLADGTAACTGLNTLGQLGDGNTTPAQHPQEVVGLSQISQISAGTATTCAVSAGSVYCWGDGRAGQLGNALLQQTPQATPLIVANVSGAVNVDVGGTSACAVVSTGQVLCWGDTTDGKLGNNRTSVLTGAGGAVAGMSGAKSVAVGYRSAVALKSDGTVWCWGDDSFGELGDGQNGTGTSVAKQVAGLKGITQIDAAGLTTCAVASSGSAYCWGDGKLGQVGGGTKGTFAVPTQVKGIPDAAQIGVGASSACLVSKSQVPACWGSNQYGQLGSGDRTGSGQGSAAPAFVVDSIRTAAFLPANLAGLSAKSTAGGAVQLRGLTLTHGGKACPKSVRVTVTAKHKSKTTTARPDRTNGACSVSGKFTLQPHTMGAKSASYAVRGTGVTTRKGTLTVLAS